MRTRICLFLFYGWLVFSSSATPASAWLGLGKFTMTDGSGDQVVVKHGLFGKKTVVSDRFGDGVERNRSIFGLTKDTQVGVLGNEVHAHKGLFGFSKTEAHTSLGDTVTSSKNPLYRTTNIDLRGLNGFFNKFEQQNQAKIPMGAPSTPYPPRNYNMPPGPDPLTGSPAAGMP